MTTRAPDDRPAAEDCTVQQPHISAIIAKFQEQSFDGLAEESAPGLLAQMPRESAAAEKFINIAELRFILYDQMANPTTDQIRDFSGLFLTSKTVYAEAETEILKLRTEYIQKEQSKWSKIYGEDNFFIDRPCSFRDLTTATVTLSRKLFEAENTGDWSKDWKSNYHRFDVERWFPANYTIPQKCDAPRCILRDLSLDRLEFRIADDDVAAPIQIHGHCILSFRNIISQTIGLSQTNTPRILAKLTYKPTRAVTRRPSNSLGAQRLDFYWGSQNVGGLDVLSEEDVLTCMKNYDGWYTEMVQEGSLSVGLSVKQIPAAGVEWVPVTD